ncbi:MAG: hypothetical protein JNK63_11290 [Chthonomonas sp.]|nr:hypothetical protein [Chthonomonas sp.]
MAVFIPPYFPEPIVVPDNVADRDYDERWKFIRFVSGLFFCAGVCSILIAVFEPISMSLRDSALIFIGCLTLHQLFRALVGGKASERWLQALLLPLTMLSTGTLARNLHDAGWPVVALGVALVGAALYTGVAGRDFSFVGQYVLAGLSTILGCIALAAWFPALMPNVWAGMALGLAGLAYLVYDFAMILKRRRNDEKLSALADLHADLLNGVTYPIRVISHWRKFII